MIHVTFVPLFEHSSTVPTMSVGTNEAEDKKECLEG